MSSTRHFINIANKYDRVVLLVDMDCFYCQVEEKLDPSLAGKPLAVVQYNAWRGGGIIAVNYAARAMGVTRHMRGDEAKEQCPDIILAKVPNVREKADLTKYRDAGKDVANVLQKFTSFLERASVDEAYLDITAEVNKRMKNIYDGTFLLGPDKLENTYAVGYENIGEYITQITSRIGHPCDDADYSMSYDPDDAPAVRNSDLRLLLGAAIASEIRTAVKMETQYECSAGIAHNKILAKLACGMNKPNKQTILPLPQITPLFRTLPVSKIKGLGAKFGEEVCERLKVKYLGDLLSFSEADLQRKLDEKSGSWMYMICRGIDLEAVTPRFYSKSIGCCKKFPGRNSITGLKTLEHWLTELSNEIGDRLEKDVAENNRRAKQMVVSYIQEINTEDISSSRSSPLVSYEPESIQKAALDVLKRNTDQFFKPGSDLALNNPIKFLGISVGKFDNITSGGQNTLQQMFANQKKKEPVCNAVEVKTDVDKSVTTGKTSTLERMFASQREATPTAKPTQAVEYTPKPSNPLKKMFANQRDKPPTVTETPPICEKPSIATLPISEDTPKANPAPRSFFATQLQKIKQQQELVASKANEETKLFSDETKPDLSSSESFTSAPTDTSIVDDSKPVDSQSFFPNKSTSPPAQPSTSLKRKSISPEVPNSTFNETYAELATPELRDEFFTTCEICGQKILTDELTLQSHQDQHMAEELSRQQREEYRKEFQSKISQNSTQKKSKLPAVANTNKKAKPNSPKAIAADIKKFMQPLTQPDQPSTSAQVNCDKCGRSMHRDLMPEHLDYHYARELQLSLNRSEMVTVTVATGSGSALNKSMKSPSSAKRSASSVAPAIKSKPITQFFSQM